ncbi:hypothetical protein SCA6_018938 [Theobroma cacao]
MEGATAATEGVLSKALSPPILDDRSRKKVRFRGDGQETDQAGSHHHPSFRDVLMSSKGEDLFLEDNRDSKGEIGLEDTNMEDSGSDPSEMERDCDADYTFRSCEGEPALDISDRKQQKLARKWRRSVVVCLLGLPISYKVLCDWIISLWSPKGQYKVVDLDEENFLVNFSLEEDYLKALLDGPWMVQGQYLIVKPWSPFYHRETQDLTAVAAWIRFPGMPLHFYHKLILRRIASIFNKLIKINYNTDVQKREKFARIAVELDLSKPLCLRFFLNGRPQQVEYEG